MRNLYRDHLGELVDRNELVHSELLLSSFLVNKEQIIRMPCVIISLKIVNVTNNQDSFTTISFVT